MAQVFILSENIFSDRGSMLFQNVGVYTSLELAKKALKKDVRYKQRGEEVIKVTNYVNKNWSFGTEILCKGKVIQIDARIWEVDNLDII